MSFFPAGCSSGVPCSLKHLSLVLKLSYLSLSFMLLPFSVLSPKPPTSSPSKHSLLQPQSPVLPVDISLYSFFCSWWVFYSVLIELLPCPPFFPGLRYGFLHQLVVPRFSLFKTSLEPSFTLNVTKDSLGSLSTTFVQIHI